MAIVDKSGAIVYRDGGITHYTEQELERMAMILKVHNLVPYSLRQLLDDKQRLVTLYFARTNHLRKAETPKVDDRFPSDASRAQLDEYARDIFGAESVDKLTADQKDEFYNSLFYQAIVEK